MRNGSLIVSGSIWVRTLAGFLSEFELTEDCRLVLHVCISSVHRITQRELVTELRISDKSLLPPPTVAVKYQQINIKSGSAVSKYAWHVSAKCVVDLRH
jgi:hypothetical protein